MNGWMWCCAGEGSRERAGAPSVLASSPAYRLAPEQRGQMYGAMS